MDKKRLNKLLKEFIDNNYLLIINFIALAGLLGSLYFSEIKELDPCRLCWYSRILTYPIAFISSVALITRDQRVYKYILTLSIPGIFLSTYHYALQKWPAVKDVANTCGVGEGTCSSIDWQVFGFVTIPLLGLVAFSAMTILAGLKAYYDRRQS